MKRSKGSAHVAIAIILVVALVSVLGVVFYRNFVAKKETGPKPSMTEPTATGKQQKASTISEISGTDMMRYTNYKLGFKFDFPKQIAGSVGCRAANQWRDNYGNMTDAPVTSYVVVPGVADVTVLESGNTFTITQKRAPLFTTATYGADQRLYNSACRMVDVTQAMLDDRSITSDWRSWQVYKINSQDDIPSVARQLAGVRHDSSVSSIQYTLGIKENDRQQVSFSYTFKDPSGAQVVGAGAMKTWYYPDQKLLVHISLGQAASFSKPTDPSSYYIQQVVDSFSVL